jgi:septal ring factor EnvC (AmiA/AmiB activator)
MEKRAREQEPKEEIVKGPPLDPNSASMADVTKKCSQLEKNVSKLHNDLKNLDLKLIKKIDHLHGDLQQADERLQRKIKYNTDEEEEEEERPGSKSERSRLTTQQVPEQRSSREEVDARSVTTPKTQRSIKSKNRNFNE